MPGKLKVLVVDDVEMNRIILSELFADSYNVLEAENGEEALERLGIILIYPLCFLILSCP